MLNEKQRAIKNRIRRLGGNRQNEFYARSYCELAELWGAKALDLDLYSEDEKKTLREIMVIIQKTQPHLTFGFALNIVRIEIVGWK